MRPTHYSASSYQSALFKMRMLILFQDASAYSRSDMTRLMRNAFDAIWLPQAEKGAFIDELGKYAVENAVDWR